MQEYLDHYLELPGAIIMFITALVVLAVLLFVIKGYVNLTAGKHGDVPRQTYVYERMFNLSQRMFELIFSGASIVFFLSVYYLIDRFLDVPSYRSFWDQYNSFLLMLFIVFSCLFNNVLDGLLIRLKFISSSDKAALRIVGMLYMFCIFMYIKFIYEDNNYDEIIAYFLGLMIGRFVYFDATFKDFLNAITDALKNIPLMILSLGYISVMALVGFGDKYLIRHNGVITNIFIAHLFMIIAIFLLQHCQFVRLLAGKREESVKTSAVKLKKKKAAKKKKRIENKKQLPALEAEDEENDIEPEDDFDEDFEEIDLETENSED
ncbi:MAG: hypothetical protein K6F39_08325 [Lachnospiraceae bacterium]|nr:hypothetical protein [Lachnospiraceae bacterium]